MGEPTLRVLSLGGGVQSTALLLMADKGEFDHKPDLAIFSDTGWEPGYVYEHLDWLKSQVSIPIERVSKGNIRADALDKQKSRFAAMPLHVRNPDGSRGMLRRQCTREYKIEPITKAVRKHLGMKRGQRVPKGVHVEMWMGITVDEMIRAKDNRVPWIKNTFPLIDRDMTRWDCQLWLQRNGYPTTLKSACIGCPFHDNAYWRWLRDERPEEWRDAVEFDKAIRKGLSGVLNDAYLHRSLVPLDEADLGDVEGQMELDLWGNECEGMCGM